MLRPARCIGGTMRALPLCAMVAVPKSLKRHRRSPSSLYSRLFAVALCLSVATSTVAADRVAATVGTIFLLDPVSSAPWRGAFEQGLRDLGYIEGRNLTLVPRY